MKPEPRQRIRWRLAGGVLAAVVLLGIGSRVEDRVRRGGATWGDSWLGIRTVAGDFSWIAVQAAWERQDPVATTAAIQRAVTWDPSRVLFWITGARMIAYDLAAWRIADAGGAEALSGALEHRWRDEQALQALAHLEAARAVLPDDVNLLIEQGNIELWARSNVAGAAAAFGRAAALAGAPEYALRLEVGLLRRLGRTPEALLRLEQSASILRPNSVNSLSNRWIDETLADLRRELEVIRH